MKQIAQIAFWVIIDVGLLAWPFYTNQSILTLMTVISLLLTALSVLIVFQYWAYLQLRRQPRADFEDQEQNLRIPISIPNYANASDSIFSEPKFKRMKKYLVRGQLMLLFMLVLLICFDSQLTPSKLWQWIQENKATHACMRLVHVNTVFLGAAVFSLVFNTGFSPTESIFLPEIEKWKTTIWN